MYQRHICPSMGAIRLPFTREVFKISNCSQRPFHVSSCRAEDAPAKPTPSAPGASKSPPATRRIRSAVAFQRLKQLPGATEQNTDGPNATSTSASQPRFTIRRVDDQGQAVTRRPPPGTLVRAPANLRLSRGPPGGPSRSAEGPNLRGNPAGRTAVSKPNPDGTVNNPRRREKKSEERSTKEEDESEKKLGETLTDGMVQHLLRLQRKEWDRVPYQPIYSSKEKLDELVAFGGTIFKGEDPEKAKQKTRKERRLERAIGIQGMHGV